MFDGAVIGGGPAGLTAALYLARYHVSVFLADAGQSRAALIPVTRNQPSWPEGISGLAMLDRMWAHLSRYPVECRRGTATKLVRLQEGFQFEIEDTVVRARSLILATGVESRRPSLSDEDHARALRKGLLRYCPICDGYEVTDLAVGIVGQGDRLFGEAKFLRSYTSSVTVLFEADGPGLRQEQRAELIAIGVEFVEAPALGYVLHDDVIEVLFGSGGRRFDTIYAAFGSKMRSELAVGLGAETTAEGCVIVDAHQRTSIPGLYAAGDVVVGMDQIGHAVGEAAVAATALRNDMCSRAPLLRGSPKLGGVDSALNDRAPSV
jgi:thioredoxin reductase (NADPH)